MDEKIIIYGAGKIGTEVIGIIGKDKVEFFIDNDKRKQGAEISGRKILSIEQAKNILDNHLIVIGCNQKHLREIEDVLDSHKITNYIQWAEFLNLHYHIGEEIVKYNNCFTGKRCFVIGSGPSLRIEDLDTLNVHNELCFAANKIFKSFTETNWRPDVYCASDRRIISYYQDVLLDLELDNMFFAYYGRYEDMKLLDYAEQKTNIHLFSIRESANKKTIDFSSDPSSYIVEGRTVIYTLIQLAIYMGVKEIYIIGVDFSYTDNSGYDKHGKDHFCKNYIEEGEEVLFSSLDYCERAFISAREFGKKAGVKIYNATRGGKLEVFPRVSFEDLFKEKSNEQITK